MEVWELLDDVCLCVLSFCAFSNGFIQFGWISDWAIKTLARYSSNGFCIIEDADEDDDAEIINVDAIDANFYDLSQQ